MPVVSKREVGVVSGEQRDRRHNLAIEYHKEKVNNVYVLFGCFFSFNQARFCRELLLWH